jgi:hypothetical protein
LNCARSPRPSLKPSLPLPASTVSSAVCDDATPSSLGFPNKKRIVSYIGTSQKVSNFERIKWNLNDYKYRLQGKFDNKFGAHAGFTKAEFIIASKPIFDVVHAMEDKYMLYKYPRLAKVIQLFIKTSLDEYIFPSNYFICMKF